MTHTKSTIKEPVTSFDGVVNGVGCLFSGDFPKTETVLMIR